ncbi:beta strand repeat-containing protein, partial [Citrobacter meridianamericanus]
NSTLAVSNASITANGGGTGGTSTVMLTLRDAKSNPVTGLTGVAFTITGSAAAGATLTPVTETPAASGIYTTTLSGTAAGTVTVGTTVGGSAFSATPATRTVTLTPDLSTATVTAMTNTTSASTKLANNIDLHSLQATVQDANNNLVSGAQVDFTVTAKSGTGGTPVLSVASGTTDATGKTPLITLKDTTAETVTVTAKVNTTAADTGKTATADFALYPVVSAVTPVINNSPADNTTLNTLTVQVQDLAGNALANQAVTLNFTGTDLKTGPATLKTGVTALSSADTAVAVTTDASGRVALTATDITAEAITVSVKTATSTQAAQTATSTFSIYPIVSSLTVGTNNVPANNTTLNTLTATVKDLKGNTLVNTPVKLTFSADKGTASFANASPWSTTTNAGGQVTLNLKDSSAVAETVNVTAYAQGSAIDQKTAGVNFVAYSLSNASVNGANFTSGIGFPTTGFTGAKFQLLMNNVTTWNGDYTWSTSQPGWMTVDASGNVTFNGTATTATKAVTLTATPKGGTAPVRTWSFTVGLWFIGTGNTMGTYAQAVSSCTGLSASVPTLAQFTSARALSSTAARSGSYNGVGPQWGTLDSYTTGWGETTTYYNSWTSTVYSGSQNYVVAVTTGGGRSTVAAIAGGWVGQNSQAATSYSTICVKTL